MSIRQLLDHTCKANECFPYITGCDCSYGMGAGMGFFVHSLLINADTRIIMVFIDKQSVYILYSMIAGCSSSAVIEILYDIIIRTCSKSWLWQLL